MDYLILIGKCLCGGLAALGFGVMFNVTHRTLFTIFFLGALGLGIRTISLLLNIEIIISSFISAVVIGFLAQLFAIQKKSPPLVIAIPSVIPMIPGIFIYEMMIGLIHLSEDVDSEAFVILLSQTVNNGLKAVFILLALSFGISIPYLVFRRDSFNYFKVLKSK